MSSLHSKEAVLQWQSNSSAPHFLAYMYSMKQPSRNYVRYGTPLT